VAQVFDLIALCQGKEKNHNHHQISGAFRNRLTFFIENALPIHFQKALTS
jgi:hypothetical protein